MTPQSNWPLCLHLPVHTLYTPAYAPPHTHALTHPAQADVFHDSLDSQASGASACLTQPGLSQPASAAGAAAWFAVAPVRAPQPKGALTHGATLAHFPAAGRRAAPAGLSPSASIDSAMAALQAGGAGGAAGAGGRGGGGAGAGEALSLSEVRRQRRRGKQAEAEAAAADAAAAAAAAAPTDCYWEQQLPPVELLIPSHQLSGDAEAPAADPNELRRQRRAARAQEAAGGWACGPGAAEEMYAGAAGGVMVDGFGTSDSYRRHRG